jgi:hypothetical protein
MWEQPCSRQEWAAGLVYSYKAKPLLITSKWCFIYRLLTYGADMLSCVYVMFFGTFRAMVG